MNKGAFFALSAAFLNALVGVLSLASFANGMSSAHVAFYKCIAAFLMLSILVSINKNHRNNIKKLSNYRWQLAIMAFFGFFCLYFFETKAYTQNSIALIVFTLLASSAITAFIASYVLTKIFSVRKLICMTLSIIGLICFTHQSSVSMNLGLVCAAIAGLGYGMFLVLNNHFKLPIHGIPLLWWLTFFGVIYLSIPFLLNAPKMIPLNSIPSILLLGIAPTIGGFYCTTKALSYTHANDVMLFESTEPLIASLLAFIFYQQYIHKYELIGALIIISAILFSINNIFSLIRMRKI
jgi:drug/metabolite transporter, DME family